MAGAWTSYRGAPAEGTMICATRELPTDGTLCLDLDGFPLLILRVGDTLRVYVNACPHQYLPLDHKGDRLMSSDRTVIRCTNHAAGFSADTGAGVEGLGIGACLDPVPVHVSGDDVLIGAGP